MMLKVLAPSVALILSTVADEVSFDPEIDSTADDWFHKGEDEVYANFQAKIYAAERAANEAVGRSSKLTALNELANLRRFKAFKKSVLWLQNEQKFGKFCYYGCYCLAALHEQEGNLAPKGKGQPVDTIDAACKIQQDCYWCAQNVDQNVKESCDQNARYHYNLTYDSADPDNVDLRGIDCLDPWFDGDGGNKKTHCKRAICECDRGLAYRLREAEADYNVNNHKLWGAPKFDDSVCTNGCSDPGNCGGQGTRDECCGDYEDWGLKFPYSTQNGDRACCGRKTYNTGMFECCAGDVIAPIGSC